jgi:hypothetical protein
MDMSWENLCRCFRESKLLGSHEVHEEHEAKANSQTSSCPSVSFVVIFELLRAFFEGSGFAAQMREHLAGEM